MPDSPLCGDVVEEEEERGGGDDGQHGRVAVHHPGDGGDGISRVVFAAVASFFEICHFYGSFRNLWCTENVNKIPYSRSKLRVMKNVFVLYLSCKIYSINVYYVIH